MKILLSVISLFLFVSIGFCQSVTISPTSTQSLLHIKKGASGVGAFNTNANLHVESNLNNYISMLTPNAFESGILFGNPTSTADGGLTSVIEEPIFVGSFNTLSFSQDVKLKCWTKSED